MNGAKTISVIIPVYNTEEYLPRCLDSIINNDYKELEIICVNDGSTDNSLSVLRKYEQNDNRIKVIDVPNGGVSNARNIGLDRATGEFVAFIDSDDWIHKQYFSILMHYQGINDSDITAVSYYKTDSGNDNINHEQDVYLNQIYTKKYNGYDALNDYRMRWFVWGKLYKCYVVSKNRFLNGLNCGEDTLYNIDCYLSFNSLVTTMVECELYYYFINSSSIIHKDGYPNYVPMARAFLDRINSISDKKKAKPFVLEAIRRCLNLRYFLDRHRNDKELSDETERVLWKYYKFEKENRCLPFFHSLIFKAFIRCPRLFAYYKYIRKKL